MKDMIATSEDLLVRTEDDFWRLPGDGLGEVVAGRAILLPPNENEHSYVRHQTHSPSVHSDAIHWTRTGCGDAERRHSGPAGLARSVLEPRAGPGGFDPQASP